MKMSIGNFLSICSLIAGIAILNPSVMSSQTPTQYTCTNGSQSAQLLQGEVIQYVNSNYEPGCYGNGNGCSGCEHSPGWYSGSSFSVWWNSPGSYQAYISDDGNSCPNFNCYLNVSIEDMYPGDSFGIAGPTEGITQCPSTYSVAAPITENPWVTYNWSINGDAQIAQGESQYEAIVNWPEGSGTCSVKLEITVNADGTIIYSDIFDVSYSDLNDVALAGTQGAINDEIFCALGGPEVYSLVGIPATYLAEFISWEVPFGCQIITANQGDEITVEFGSNAISGLVTAHIETDCGTVATKNLEVFVTPPLPLTPPIVGPRVLCAGASGVKYFVPEVPFATSYIWEVNGAIQGSDDHILTKSFPGEGTYEITVTPEGECGLGEQMELQLEVFEDLDFLSIEEVTLLDGILDDFASPVELLMNPCENSSECVDQILESAFLEVEFDTGEMYEYGDVDFLCTIDVRVEMYDQLDGGNLVASEIIPLTISNSSPRSLFRKDITSDFLGVIRYEVYVDDYLAADYVDQSVELQVNYTSSWKTDANTVESIFDEPNMFVSTIVGSNKMQFGWPLKCPEVKFDNYELQVLKIEDVNDDIGTEEGVVPQYPNFLVDWSEALTIETQSSNTWINITLAEGSGYYLWRVRPIGNLFDNGIADDRNWGLWSSVGSNIDGYEIPGLPNTAQSYCFEYEQFDKDLNWIYSRVFLEEDSKNGVKIGENMEYANSLHHPLIAQTMSNENGLVVKQSIQDYIGRKVVSTLPVPANGRLSVGFQEDDLLENELGERYGPMNFDECENWNNPESISLSEESLHSYYSDYNLENPVSDCEGFPFYRVLFGNDGRIKESSGPGESLRLKPFDGNTTRTYYSSVMQDELLRIFGEEAPVATNIQKIITIDPNGVGQGYYISKTGNILASFLVNNGNNDYHGPLENDLNSMDPQAGDLLHGLKSKEAGFVASQVIENHIPVGTNAVQSVTTVTTSEPSVNVEIDYTITPASFENECAEIDFCTTCDYKVRIKVLPLEHDYCSPDGVAPPLFDQTELFPGEILFGSCGPDQTFSAWPSATVVLADPGSYQIWMEVTTANINPTSISVENPNGTSFLTEGLAELETLLFESYQLGLFDNLEGVFFDGQHSLLEEWDLATGFTSEINPEFSLDAMYDLWLSGDGENLPASVQILYLDSEETIISHFEYIPSDLCEVIVIPYLPCAIPTAQCFEFNYITNFNSYWSDEFSSNPELYDEFDLPTLNQALLGSQYNPGTFQLMVKNMLNEEYDGEALYDCSEIMECWEFMRDSYLDMTTLYAEEGGEYNFAEEFLSCAGRYLCGFTSNGAAINTSVGNGVYMSNGTGASYITHAYSFIELASVPTLDPDSPLNSCFNACPLEQGTEFDLSCVVQDPTLETFFQNYDLYGTQFSNWGWNNTVDLTLDDISLIWFSFSQCLSNVEQGIASGPLSQEEANQILADVNQTMISECFDKCNSLYDNFYDAIVDEYHEQGLYIEVDQYVMEPEFASEIEYDTYFDFMETYGLSWPIDFVAIYEALQGGAITYIDEFGTTVEVDAIDWTPHPSFIFDDPASDIPFYWSFVPEDMIVPVCEVECLSTAVLNHCKATCDVSWNGIDVDGNGMIGSVPTENGEITEAAMEELLAIQEVITSTDFDISFPEVPGECEDGYDLICVHEDQQVVDDSNGNTGWGTIGKDVTEPVKALWKTTGREGQTIEPNCSTCSNVPTPLEFTTSINNALNDFITFLDNSSALGNYMPYNGWTALGNVFRWQWDHPYFDQSRDCVRDGVTIDIVMSVKECENPATTAEVMGYLLDVYSIGNTGSHIGIYSLDISIGTIGQETVLSILMGDCVQNDIPNYGDMLEAMPFGFTNTQFSLVVNAQDEIDISFPVPTGNGIYHGSFATGNTSAYVMAWPLLAGNENCNSGNPHQVEPQKRYAINDCIDFYDLLPFCERFCPGTSAELCFDWGQIQGPDDWQAPEPVLCEDEHIAQLFLTTTEQIQEIVTQGLAAHHENYVQVCADPLEINDELKYALNLNYHHYALYYYDRAGNLVSTVPPEGVQLQDQLADWDGSFQRIDLNHRLVTKYAFNSLDRLLEKYIPDLGATKYAYNSIGFNRFSQNAQQALDSEFSYSKYDALGRFIEGGVSSTYGLEWDEFVSESEIDDNSFPNADLSQVVRVFYSTPCTSPSIEQNFIRNRVSYSVSLGEANDQNITTAYSYDPHGNVETVYQYIPAIGLKTTSYLYDLVTGNILEIQYQPGQADQFLHRYSYDMDNRLVQVETSKDAVIWENDTQYEYYIHGPLKRTVIGSDKVQGLDYIYTLNGWLKSINHPSLDAYSDPGQDGITVSSVAKDAFGMQLNYFSGDYRRTTGEGVLFDSSNPISADLNSGDLFNGNISSWLSQVQYPSSVNDIQYQGEMTGYVYKYDELNRLIHADFMNFQSGAWQDPNSYESFYRYDANGNLENLRRTAYGSGDMDKLKYHYETDSDGKKLSNKLYHYSDYGTDNEYNDLKPTVEFNALDIDDNNYLYDAVGNLVRDREESIESISWFANGKVSSIIHNEGDRPNMYFEYDALGNRVSKLLVPKDELGEPLDEGNWNWTYYVRDATGNVMAIYKKDNSPTDDGYMSTLTLAELPIYGSSRIGVYKPLLNLEQFNANSETGEFTPVEIQGFEPQSSSWTTIYNDVDNIVSVVKLGFSTNEIQVLSEGASFSGSLSSEPEVLVDEIGNLILSAIGIENNNVVNLEFSNGAGNALPGLESISLKPQSSLLALNLSTKNEFRILSVGIDGKLYFHDIDMNLNGGQGGAKEIRGVPQVNQPVNSKFVFEGSMEIVNRTDRNERTISLVRIEKSGSKVLHLLTFDSNGILVSSVDAGSYIRTDSDSPKSKMSVSHNGEWISFSNKSGDQHEIALYQRDARSKSYRSAGIINVNQGFAVEDIVFGPASKMMYYSGRTGTATQIVAYNLTSKGIHNVVNGQSSTPTSLSLGADGNLYSSGVNNIGILSFENPYLESTIGVEVDAPVGLSSVNGISVQTQSLTIEEYSGLFERFVDQRDYEIIDHLGNVRAVVSDIKMPSNYNFDGFPVQFEADIKSANNYYAFGMRQPGRNSQGPGYRYGFQGQEIDEEWKGGAIAFKYRIHDPRLGRFLSVDPLVSTYTYNSPYAFAENKVIAFIELEGLETLAPRIGPLTIPETIITLPRAPTISIPMPPANIPIPPIVMEPTINPIHPYPTAPSKPHNFESDIDWENPPTSPEALGEGWEDVTPEKMRQNTENREFQNKETGEKVRWDPGKEGKSGWEGKDHWHRYNPNKTSKRDMYLDRFNNPVGKGSNSSHIGAGESFLMAVPGLIQDVESQIDALEKENDQYSIWNIDHWDKIQEIWDKIDVLEDYKDQLEDYYEEWEEYYEDRKRYYDNCDCWS